MNVATPPHCRTVRSWISAAYDDELSFDRQVAMDAHLASYAACRRTRDEISVLGVALRRGAAERRPDDTAFAGLQTEVLARTAFTPDASWRQRVREMVDEGTGLWIVGGALASTMAMTLFAAVLNATPVQPGSLAGLLQKSVALGSNATTRSPSRQALPGRGRRRTASHTRPSCCPACGPTLGLPRC